MLKRILAGVGLLVGAGAVYVFLLAKPHVNLRFEPLLSDSTVPVIWARGLKDGEAAGFGPSFPGGDRPCASELMVVIHGFNNSAEKAMNRFGVARQALAENGYRGEVAGFSWDANTQHDPYSATGYHAGRRNSRVAGKALAEAIERLQKSCPGITIRLIGYSMGARVALETLLHLQGKVESVHLVGAALDNEEVEVGQEYGKAIADHAGRVFNYYSPEDSKLGLYYWVKEGDRALGKSDIEHPERKPANYVSVNVGEELPEVDEETGRLIPNGKKGRNHSGYLGTRDNRGQLTDDGVMDVIVRDVDQLR